MTDKTKHYLHSYGFFTVTLLLMVLILFLVVFFTRNSGTKSIKSLLEERIDVEFNYEFNVGNVKNINLPLNSSSYAYEVENAEGTTENLGTIIALRLTGIYGPGVGVFIQKPNTYVFEYVGSLVDFSKDLDFSWNKMSKVQIKYWTDNLQKYFISESLTSKGEE